MHRHSRVTVAVLGMTLLVSAAQAVAQTQAKSTVEEIRKELMQLPYYGVFDFLAFDYEKGTTVLVGYAYHPGLKNDAIRAVKRAAGVDQVVDKIEELPPSPMDDELRWKIYYAIYRDPFLLRRRITAAKALPSSNQATREIAGSRRVVIDDAVVNYMKDRYRAAWCGCVDAGRRGRLPGRGS